MEEGNTTTNYRVVAVGSLATDLCDWQEQQTYTARMRLRLICRESANFRKSPFKNASPICDDDEGNTLFVKHTGQITIFFIVSDKIVVLIRAGFLFDLFVPPNGPGSGIKLTPEQYLITDAISKRSVADFSDLPDIAALNDAITKMEIQPHIKHPSYFYEGKSKHISTEPVNGDASEDIQNLTDLFGNTAEPPQMHTDTDPSCHMSADARDAIPGRRPFDVGAEKIAVGKVRNNAAKPPATGNSSATRRYCLPTSPHNVPPSRSLRPWCTGDHPLCPDLETPSPVGTRI